jgi:hypothetical protein
MLPENIQQISKFLSQNIFLGPSSVLTIFLNWFKFPSQILFYRFEIEILDCRLNWSNLNSIDFLGRIWAKAGQSGRNFRDQIFF